jgi:hypothetical protein
LLKNAETCRRTATYSDILVQLLVHTLTCEIEEFGTECGISDVMIVPVIIGATGHSKKIITENV